MRGHITLYVDIERYELAREVGEYNIITYLHMKCNC